MIVSRSVLFLVAFALLYYSTTMLLFVPTAFQDPYLSKNRVLFGVIPLLISSAILVLVAKLSARASGLPMSGRSIVLTLACAVVTVVAFDVSGLIITGLIRK